MRRFLLLDANVMAGYYLPRSLSWMRARERIRCIVDAARTGEAELFLYIPNFAIAETISVFIKYGLGKWNHQVTNAGGKLDRRVYERLIRQFQADIHNGAVVNQYELSRYHILGINLVAPIDHYFQISRKRGKRKNRRIQPAGAFDHLIISMGIQLAKVHGPDAVTIVSTDQRLCGGGREVPQWTYTRSYQEAQDAHRKVGHGAGLLTGALSAVPQSCDGDPERAG